MSEILNLRRMVINENFNRKDATIDDIFDDDEELVKNINENADRLEDFAEYVEHCLKNPYPTFVPTKEIEQMKRDIHRNKNAISRTNFRQFCLTCAGIIGFKVIRDSVNAANAEIVVLKKEVKNVKK